MGNLLYQTSAYFSKVLLKSLNLTSLSVKAFILKFELTSSKYAICEYGFSVVWLPPFQCAMGDQITYSYFPNSECGTNQADKD
jgi:hypothetical protein